MTLHILVSLKENKPDSMILFFAQSQKAEGLIQAWL
jgi:hypothetical protein